MAVGAITFFTTGYVCIDTFCAATPPPPVRRGSRQKMRDSEILTILLPGRWHGTSECGTLAWIRHQHADAFSVLRQRPGDVRRGAAAAGRHRVGRDHRVHHRPGQLQRALAAGRAAAVRQNSTAVPMGIEALPSPKQYGRTLVGPVGHHLSRATFGERW